MNQDKWPEVYDLLYQLGVTAAKQYNTNWKAVERNIRTVNCIIWREKRPLLEELAHRHLDQKPRNAQLLSILTCSLNAGALEVNGSGERL